MLTNMLTNIDLSEAVLTALDRQNQLMEAILSELSKPRSSSLGLSMYPVHTYIYCNRAKAYPHLWYTIKGGEPSPVEAISISGYVVKFQFEVLTRMGEEAKKLQTTISTGDRLYTLESSHDSNFSKGLMAAFAEMTPEQLRHPVTIEPQPSQEDTAKAKQIVFAKVSQRGEAIYCRYDQDTDWKTIAGIALNNVWEASNPF